MPRLIGKLRTRHSRWNSQPIELGGGEPCSHDDAVIKSGDLDDRAHTGSAKIDGTVDGHRRQSDLGRKSYPWIIIDLLDCSGLGSKNAHRSSIQPAMLGRWEVEDHDDVAADRTSG